MTMRYLSTRGGAAERDFCNPQAQWSKKRGQYRQRDLCSEGGKEEKFLLYLRESLNDEKDFSCGLSLIQSGVRNPGSNHPHQEIHYQCYSPGH